MQEYTFDLVQALLYEAGEVRMRQRVRGCWPSGYRSGMPEARRDPEDLLYAETDAEPDQPTCAEVTKADEVEGWIRQLPFGTPVEIRRRQIIQDGMLTRPDSDERVHSPAALGAKYRLEPKQVECVWARGVDALVTIANDSAVTIKVGTMARIRAASMRPLPGACAETLRRIRQHQSAKSAELVSA